MLYEVITGVCRYCASETRDLPEDKQRWFWVASWPLPDGRRKRVKFSVKKYGEDGAFQRALEAREEALRNVITSYSIHYTKLYERSGWNFIASLR